jgi:hypothetical protein
MAPPRQAIASSTEYTPNAITAETNTTTTTDVSPLRPWPSLSSGSSKS